MSFEFFDSTWKTVPKCFRFNSGKHIFFRISEENEKDSPEVL
jgi:hypothetical protein